MLNECDVLFGSKSVIQACHALLLHGKIFAADWLEKRLAYTRSIATSSMVGYILKVHFVCKSWVYPSLHNKKDRIFFTDKAYLPHQTPALLWNFQEEELETLRGKGTENAMLKESDRVFDYAYYNDLREPHKGLKFARPMYG